MKIVFLNIWNWWRNLDKAEVMLIDYDLTTGKMKAIGWDGKKVPYFCDNWSESLWNELRYYCRINSSVPTKIFIWAGYKYKHLAYNEPIDSYLDNPKLLSTGQGFHFHTGEKRPVNENEICCRTCGRAY